MRAPTQWLADYVDIEMTTDDLAHRLTMAGLKVESIERPGADWQDVYIGEVVEIEPHPGSRKPLWVAKVSLGESTITVVTGAQNVRRGNRVPVVLVGGRLPHGPDGSPMIIERKPMAGITSDGMLASERELGLSEEHSGIYILPPDAPVGRRLREVMAGDVLDIETNPNRPDTLSMIGIAREIAALTEQQLSLPDLDVVGDTVTWLDEESLPVRVDAPDLCPRYSALRVEGVSPGMSPLWLSNRLQAAGMRPINLLVDLTNYIMLEYGQPMHAFDATLLAGGQIVVRRARPNERIRTLDGVEKALEPETLVIADAERAVAIAGVMGGENSEIKDDTSTIVLESATFDPVSVRRTAQALTLRTESSARFEKNLPPEQTVLGLKRYVQLLQQITGLPLRVARITDVAASPPPERTVTMPMRDLHRLTGLPISPEQAAEVLSLLGFEVEYDTAEVRARVPYWRRADIELSADLVEEVIRVVGYDAIPSTLPRRTVAPAAPLDDLRLEDTVRSRLLGYGVSESVTHSLTSPEAMARLAAARSNGHSPEATVWADLVPNPAGVYAREAEILPVEIANPATRDRRVMRLTLLPSLLDVVSRNLRHTDERVAFFEIARTIFRRPNNLPYERRTLSLLLSGSRLPRTWQDDSPGPYTFFDMKGMLAGVLEPLRIAGWYVEPGSHAALHPGRSARLRAGGHDIAYFGTLHPTVAERFDIEGWPVQVAEVDLDTVLALSSPQRVFQPLPRHPAAYRDIAIVVADAVPAGDVVRVVREAGGDLLESYRIFDVYRGSPLQEGMKSIAIGLTFRAPGATLTQDEVNEVVTAILGALQERLGATLRE
ncbi:MAG TPA: phenylalanine--tRNA ligase subunit beta [Chloroflexota bacterium]|nr:phenylalanine--tRNA ligase subunit beta [Chloroflexota bacterium]